MNTDSDVKEKVSKAIWAPEAVDAEEMLLGVLLMEPSQIPAAIGEKLTTSDFFIIRNGWVYGAIIDLYTAGEIVDTVTVAERLRAKGVLEEVGGSLELTRLMLLPTGYSWNASAYAVIVRRKSEERNLLECLRAQTQAILNNPAVPTLDKWSAVMDAVQALRPVDAANDMLLGRDTTSYLDTAIEYDIANPAWYYLPYPTLTSAGTTVYKPGDIVMVGGSYGSGKSAFVLQWGQHLAEVDHKRVLVAFTEMDKQNVLMRRLARNSRLPYTKLLTPEKLTPDELAQYYRDNYDMGDWTERVDLWECGTLEARAFVAELRSKVERYHHDVVIVDGFNDLVFEPKKGDTQAGAIHNFMGYMETFAREHHVLLIATVQLNDDGQSLGSRAYERKAALYLKIQTDKSESGEQLTYDGLTFGAEPGEYSIYRTITIAKNRRGPTGGRVRMPFVGPRFKWVDITEIAGKSANVDLSVASPAFADNGGRDE